MGGAKKNCGGGVPLQFNRITLEHQAKLRGSARITIFPMGAIYTFKGNVF
jgi:hypothetical protein